MNLPLVAVSELREPWHVVFEYFDKVGQVRLVRIRTLQQFELLLVLLLDFFVGRLSVVRLQLT